MGVADVFVVVVADFLPGADGISDFLEFGFGCFLPSMEFSVVFGEIHFLLER